MSKIIAGITVPDSQLAREVDELVRDTESELLYHHSNRVFLFGALAGQRKALKVDAELLYVGAMFHDMGLQPPYASADERFEVDGANAAADFLRSRAIDERDIDDVWDSIALHTTPGIPELLGAEIALVTAGVETDVLGIGYEDLDSDLVAAVTAAHPRPDFKRRILEAFRQGNADRPETTFGNVNADVLARYEPGFARTDFVDVILGSAWAE